MFVSRIFPRDLGDREERILPGPETSQGMRIEGHGTTQKRVSVAKEI